MTTEQQIFCSIPRSGNHVIEFFRQEFLSGSRVVWLLPNSSGIVRRMLNHNNKNQGTMCRTIRAQHTAQS